MPIERSLEVKFEIGHVLFIDIVGYSKLLITEQSQQLEILKTIVLGTEQSRTAQAEGKLLRLPTGDDPRNVDNLLSLAVPRFQKLCEEPNK